MRFRWMSCAVAGLLTLVTSAALADTTINYSLAANAPTFFVTYKMADGNTRTNEDVRAGYFTATVDNNPSFQVYCVDLENNTASPSQVAVNAVVVPLANPNQHYDGTPGTYLDLAKASWLFDQFNSLSLADSTGIRGAALQAAIWNVIDGDTDFNVTSGIFSISDDGHGVDTASIITDANSYLSALSAALALGGTNGQDSGVLYQVDRGIAGFAKPNGQDMLGGSGSFIPHTPDTPEGASLLMFLPGLIPVAIGLRRRRNKSIGK